MNQEMVPFQAVKRKQIADEVAEQLQRKIAAGEWDVGTKIPTEPELMKLFGVGRSTVREAVSVLVHAGLLEKKQGHGTFVCQPTTSQEPLDYRLSRAEIIEVYEVRSVLELEIARLAALRRKDEDLRLMREALDRRAVTLAAGDLNGYLDADITFHLAVAGATRNKVLTDVYRSFVEAIRKALKNLVTDPAMQNPFTLQHEKIYEAIRDQDAKAAELYSIQHLDGTKLELQKHMGNS
ncbi:FadR/GntR family transcriptional regulator [Paenibacillus terrae]|uniref:Transcriptional regulator n=1 Tax=Paenibacillus terrae TaxID=159743 RepID=A0A0D7X2M2_9BACL|nr:FadR/GntR family transcriptional regulator [Paenibacillus terrae]KJD44262.1 transcriptional regulator [Paenibacillus terrae]